MNIRNKFALSFSVIGAIILFLFGFTIYIISSEHRKKEFDKRLSQRVNITEKMFLEKENFSKEDFEQIKSQFLHTLPKEKEEVIEVTKEKLRSIQKSYPDNFIQDILINGEASFEKGDRQGVGKYFHLNGGDYLVIVSAVDVAGIESQVYLKRVIIIGVIISILLFSFLSVPLSSRVINPLSYKIKMANKISASNLHQRLTGITSKDEIGELATAFNNLLDRIESAFEAKKAFIANASHEIKNPLTSIINEVDISLDRDRTNEEYRETLKSISHESGRMKLLVDNLFALSKVSYANVPFRFEYLPLIPLLDQIIKEYQFSNRENKIQLTITDEANRNKPGIWGNKNLLTSAVINILDNACKFSSNDIVKITLDSNENNAVITVVDKGIGISEEDLKMVTEPFFRSSGALGVPGSGIGIPLAYKIINIHNGKFEITSQLGKGTEVKIFLPIEENLKS